MKNTVSGNSNPSGSPGHSGAAPSKKIIRRKRIGA